MSGSTFVGAGVVAIAALALSACSVDVVGDESLRVGVYEAGSADFVWDRYWTGAVVADSEGCAVVALEGTTYLAVFEEGVVVESPNRIVDARDDVITVGERFAFDGMPLDELNEIGDVALPDGCADTYLLFGMGEVLARDLNGPLDD